MRLLPDLPACDLPSVKATFGAYGNNCPVHSDKERDHLPTFLEGIDMAGGGGEISGRRRSASTGSPLDGPGDRCPSCAEPGRGRYCSACGERFLVDHDFSLRYFFLETLPHEVLDIDGKFLRTLRLLLLRPGMLASEYVVGRRQQYVGPLRFYVIAFLLHATLVALLAGHGNERGHWFAEIGTMLIFLGIAALQKLVFFRSGRRYLEHVALSLNIVSFYIVVLLLVEVGLGIFGRSHFGDYDADAQKWAAVTLLPVYWFLAIRRFYGLRALPSLFGALIMWVGHVLIASCMNLLVLRLISETA
jgi:Protein of unknown function (DUF3667)